MNPQTSLLSKYGIALIMLLPVTGYTDTGHDAIEAHYRYYTNVGGQDFDGLSVKGALQLPADFYLFGEFTPLSANSNIDQTMILGGVGRGYQITPQARLYGGISYERVKIEASSPLATFSATGHGAGLRGGTRYTLTKHVELKAEMRYVNLHGDINDDHFGINIGSRLLVSRQIDLIAEYDNLDGDHGLSIGVCYTF